MERRRLGGTEVEVSRIILGCGNFGGIGSAPEFFGQGESEEEGFGIMDAAWALGITMFDTADADRGGPRGDRAAHPLARPAPPAVVQNSYSLLDRNDEEGVLGLCFEFGVAYTPFSPLAGGWLTGKYKRDEVAPAGSRMALRPGPYEHLRTERTFAALDRFAEIAERR